MVLLAGEQGGVTGVVVLVVDVVLVLDVDEVLLVVEVVLVLDVEEVLLVVEPEVVVEGSGSSFLQEIMDNITTRQSPDAERRSFFMIYLIMA